VDRQDPSGEQAQGAVGEGQEVFGYVLGWDGRGQSAACLCYVMIIFCIRCFEWLGQKCSEAFLFGQACMIVMIL